MTRLWNHRLVNKEVMNGLPKIKVIRENLKTDSSPTKEQVTENPRTNRIIPLSTSPKLRKTRTLTSTLSTIFADEIWITKDSLTSN